MELDLIERVKKMIRQRKLKRQFPKSTIYQGAFADKASTLGEYTVLFKDAIVIESSVGPYTYVQAQSAIYNTDIGAYCSIASGVTIGLGAHPTNMVSTSPVFYDNQQPLPKFFSTSQKFTEILPRTTIGADVWIGQAAMIKAGISIGTGAVIGAGAVVTKDIPPYAIVGGVPCKIIRMRFSEEICKKLIDSYWWELDETKLSECAPFFSDPEVLLDFLAKK